MKDEIAQKIAQNIDSLIPHGQAKRIAQELGVSEDTISVWRRSDRKGTPNVIDFIRLAKALRVSIYQLAGFDHVEDEHLLQIPPIRKIVEILGDSAPAIVDIYQQVIEYMAQLSLREQEEILSVIEKYYKAKEQEYAMPTGLRARMEAEGELTPHAPPDTVQEPSPTYHAEQAYIEIVQYPYMAAGPPIEMNESLGTYPVPASLITDDPSAYYVVGIRGESMSDLGIHNEDLVLMHKQSELRSGKVYGIRQGGEATLKELHIEYNAKGQVEYNIVWQDGSGQSQKLESEDWAIMGEYVCVVKKT